MRQSRFRTAISIALVLWMSLYTHEALSHMGLSHHIGGTPAPGQKTPYHSFYDRGTLLEKCPWSSAEYLFHSTETFQLFVTFTSQREHTPEIYSPITVAFRRTADSRAPPAFS